ncbi:MAG: hypothetical protein LUG57_07750 [Oscillospiraceae bacterium]|nr:hypothetical protein [Oscillospiraceae bacterium]
MMKMVIAMDEEKIRREKTYRLEGIYSAIDGLFAGLGMPRIEGEGQSLTYRDRGLAQDYGRFGRAVNTLKRQGWFMDNVSAWVLYDSDDGAGPEDFSQEDLLRRYSARRAVPQAIRPDGAAQAGGGYRAGGGIGRVY